MVTYIFSPDTLAKSSEVNFNFAEVEAEIGAVSSGLDVKDACRLSTDSNITLSGNQTIDGVLTLTGDRILVKNQTSAFNNGIYTASSGAWSRSTDADVSAEVTSGLFTFITEGTLRANTGWLLITPDPIILGTTNLSFAQFAGSPNLIPGDGLYATGNTWNVGAGSGIIANTNDVQVDTTVLRTNPVNQTITTGTTTLASPAIIAVQSGATLDLQSGTIFNVKGSATSVNVTGTNLNTLTASSSSNADSLHTHNSLSKWFSQSFSSLMSVNVVHNLGRKPQFQIVLNTGEVVLPNTQVHNSDNDFTITFTSSQTGSIIYLG